MKLVPKIRDAVLLLLAIVAAAVIARAERPARPSAAAPPVTSAPRPAIGTKDSAPLAPLDRIASGPSTHTRRSETSAQLRPIARNARAATPARAPARGGMVAGIDPASGRLAEPTAEQLARLGASKPGRAGISSARPAPVYHADGSISLDARSWMREHAVARVGPDGQLMLGCVDSRAPAKDAAREAPLTPAALEER